MIYLAYYDRDKEKMKATKYTHFLYYSTELVQYWKSLGT